MCAVCLLRGKGSAEEQEEGKESLEHSGNENEVRQHSSVARLAHRQGFPDWFFIPNKRQKASRPVATGIGGGRLWGRAGLWRSYVLHRIWGCYLRLPTSVSISEHVKLVIRRLCLCGFHLFEPVPGSENLPAGRAGSLLWSVGLLQAVCSLCTIFCSLFCLCLHLMYIYSQRSGASAGNWSFSKWRALPSWGRFIISTFLGCLTWEILSSWCGEKAEWPLRICKKVQPTQDCHSLHNKCDARFCQTVI